jgi:hypothetical protein
VFEFGTFAEERARTDMKTILDKIEHGASLAEIRQEFPTQFLMYQKKFEAYQQQVRGEQQESAFRTLKVIYVHGRTGTGKTRHIMERFGYANVYRVTNYDQRAFDGYKGQDVILFDEFRSQFKIAEMLNYLDGYPLNLPCRYADKPACYTKVFIVSNVPLAEQYHGNEFRPDHETWRALLRRIDAMYNFSDELERLALQRGEILESTKIKKEMLNSVAGIDTLGLQVQFANARAREQERYGLAVSPCEVPQSCNGRIVVEDVGELL